MTPAQQQAVRDAEEDLGRLDCPHQVAAGLYRLGLAAAADPERASYLTLAGWTVRNQLADDAGDKLPRTSTGPFAPHRIRTGYVRPNGTWRGARPHGQLFPPCECVLVWQWVDRQRVLV